MNKEHKPGDAVWVQVRLVRRAEDDPPRVPGWYVEGTGRRPLNGYIDPEDIKDEER